MKNKEVSISSEKVKFDENGIGDIQSQDLYNEVITFPNFQSVEDDITKTEDKIGEGENIQKEADVEIPVEEPITETKGEEKKIEVKKTASKK